MGSCAHLRDFKNEEVLSSYELLHAVYVACIMKNSGIRKVRDCICSKCDAATAESLKNSPENTTRKLFRIQAVHACLSCVYFGCFKGDCHINQHYWETSHSIAMDTDSGEIFCCVCGDYKYDVDFMKIAKEQNAFAKQRISAMESKVTPVIGKPDKFEPSPELVNILRKHLIMPVSHMDVRPLYNLGRYTCYLNAVIQCLIHAPVFRDYLLSLPHRCLLRNPKTLCMICLLTETIQQSFSGREKPLALNKLLFAFFKRCKLYASQDHQDALICFEDLIVNFHEDETERIPKPPRTTPLSIDSLSSCDCIIHQIFGFEMYKEERCQNCNHVTDEKSITSAINLNKLEPVPLEPDNNQSKQNPDGRGAKKNVRGKGRRKKDTQNLEGVTLKDCLQSTWNAEGICRKCKHEVTILRQRPLNLPYILTIISNQYDYLRCASMYLKFEEVLDLSPYIVPFWQTIEDSKTEYIYYLFGVVKFLPGHYLCYIKKNNQWYKSDNEQTSAVPVDEVLKIHVRLLFYHKMFM